MVPGKKQTKQLLKKIHAFITTIPDTVQTVLTWRALYKTHTIELFTDQCFKHFFHEMFTTEKEKKNNVNVASVTTKSI